MTDPVLVRALRDAVRVPGAAAPYDTVQLTVRYPARPATTTAERMSGVLPAVDDGAPYPVVVVLPGVNVASAGYAWLASRLVEAGYVCATFDWVGELFPGQVGLTPGVDLAVATPQAYGSAPTTPALAPVLGALAGLGAEGVLAGLLDLDRVAVLGHSAGGTVALQSAGPQWFPGVRAVVAYGAHTMASQQLGFPAGSLLSSPVQAPVLLVAGALDGVVSASAVRYGEEAGAPAHDPVERTWREAFEPGTEAWLAVLAGAGHLLPVDPDDPTSARGFLEEPLSTDQDRLRETFAELVTNFLNCHLCGDPAAKMALDQLLNHPAPEFAEFRRR